jgi:hypothetical protein
MAWTLRQMVDQNGIGAAAAVSQLKAYIATVQDPRQRTALDRALRRLELQVGPVGPVAPLQQDASARTVGSTASAPSTVVPAAAPAAPPVDAAVLEDPNGVYTREVSAAIIDAMIENSGPLPLGDNEWLTVAARGNDTPLGTQQTLQDTVTITVRVKGSDLATYHSDPSRRAEIREKVKAEAKVF